MGLESKLVSQTYEADTLTTLPTPRDRLLKPAPFSDNCAGETPQLQAGETPQLQAISRGLKNLIIGHS